MDNAPSNFAISRFPSHHFAQMRFLCRFLCLLFCVGLLTGAATATDVPIPHAASLGPNLSFSIADLDGDSKPDLASVQVGKSDLIRTDYWIQLQLSAAGRQSFRIVAPTGGLQIIARDVNGDRALDLVVTTAWLRQPVAILLNDGQGTFSRVEPDAFPEAFTESKTGWSCNTERAIDSVGAPPQPREDICSVAGPFAHLRSQSRFFACSDSRFVACRFLIFHSGRAPPFEVPQS
jgi:hypothetical protein